LCSSVNALSGTPNSVLVELYMIFRFNMLLFSTSKRVQSYFIDSEVIVIEGLSDGFLEEVIPFCPIVTNLVYQFPRTWDFLRMFPNMLHEFLTLSGTSFIFITLGRLIGSIFFGSIPKRDSLSCTILANT
jgi:hypothetical protein